MEVLEIDDKANKILENIKNNSKKKDQEKKDNFQKQTIKNKDYQKKQNQNKAAYKKKIELGLNPNKTKIINAFKEGNINFYFHEAKTEQKQDSKLKSVLQNKLNKGLENGRNQQKTNQFKR